MRRAKQQISKEKCIEVLKTQPRGVLSVIGDDGYPYGLPITHYYDEESGKIYFHGAKEGHKMDAVRANDKVSFCTYDEGYRKEGEWALNINSVIVFGRIRILEDRDEVLDICSKLVAKFTDDKEYLEDEIRHFGKVVQVLELTPEVMTGKLVNES